MNEHLRNHHKLLVTIVKKGNAKKILKASKEAGAEGGTVIYGKGTGIHENRKFLGISIEPEKEAVLTLIPMEKLDIVIRAVEKAANLDKPGYGIGFVVDVKRVAGIAHLLNLQSSETGGNNGR
ncbi:P-II family nitrogen regulator [Evansella clarkii]|uniref:P-II family nitrogen regulator n=1 Tax=Evansella clarkii TaxID=79879 RepID=UPI001FD41F2A|nr:P-II family nitrogen regulator [Evansella clarkii]